MALGLNRTETAVLGRDIPDRPSKAVESNHPLVITGGNTSGGALPLPLPIPTQPETVSSAISATAVNTTPTTEGSSLRDLWLIGSISETKHAPGYPRTFSEPRT